MKSSNWEKKFELGKPFKEWRQGGEFLNFEKLKSTNTLISQWIREQKRKQQQNISPNQHLTYMIKLRQEDAYAKTRFFKMLDTLQDVSGISSNFS